MERVILWCALRIADLAEWLYDRSGDIITWCDDRAWRKASAAKCKQWEEWIREDYRKKEQE